MIKIVLLLLLFLLYVSVQIKKEKEGLRNYAPLTLDGKIYGVNVIRNHEENIHKMLTTEGSPLYDVKFTKMVKSDVVLDMQYFNNASYLIFLLSGN